MIGKVLAMILAAVFTYGSLGGFRAPGPVPSDPVCAEDSGEPSAEPEA